MGLLLRPWETKEASGLPLFNMEYAGHTFAVHEGDAPHALGEGAAKHFNLLPVETRADEIAKRILGHFETMFPPQKAEKVVPPPPPPPGPQ